MVAARTRGCKLGYKRWMTVGVQKVAVEIVGVMIGVRQPCEDEWDLLVAARMKNVADGDEFVAAG